MVNIFLTIFTRHLRWPGVVPRGSHSYESVWVLSLNHTIHLNIRNNVSHQRRNDDENGEK